ncbi:Serine/threonine-protein kinase SMG1 [Trichoplax sp. H2]|nr:Serine/threonine-protein kinase SMG1 [Trichoplax sp. H2]|eukprot:RDD40629.1 Serine/threonine-protein kinase SMG1 [Trichoplax sp. H2]
MSARPPSKNSSKRWHSSSDHRYHGDAAGNQNDDEKKYRGRREVDADGHASYSRSATRHQARHQYTAKDHPSSNPGLVKRAIPTVDAIPLQNAEISRFLKTIVSSDDQLYRKKAAIGFQQCCLLPESIEVIRKYASAITSSFEDILLHQNNSNELKQETSLCLGYVGKAMGRDSQMFFDKLLSKAGDENLPRQTNIYFLQAIIKALQLDATEQTFQPLAAVIMNKTRDYLESADDSSVLVCLVQIIDGLKHYNHIFKNHFKNFVDILIGWLLDNSQPAIVKKCIKDTLINFKTYWILEASFSLNLLEQFVEDMEAYVKELNNKATTSTSYAELLVKVPALCSVFTIIVQCLHATPVISTQVAHFHKLGGRIIQCGNSYLKRSLQECCLATNNCIIVLAKYQQKHFVSLCETILDYAFDQMQSRWCRSSDAATLSVLLFINEVKVISVETWKFSLIKRIKSVSALIELECSSNMKVLMTLLNIYVSLLLESSDCINDDIFSMIVDRLMSRVKELKMTAVDKLRGNHDSKINRSSSSVNQAIEHIGTSDIEKSIVFYLQILSTKDVLNLKKKQLPLLYLKAFEMLTELALRYPVAHFTLLYCMHNLCKDISVLNKHLKATVTCVSNVLRQELVSVDSKKFCLGWILEIADLVARKDVDLPCNLDIVANPILPILFHTEESMRLTATKCIRKLLELKSVTVSFCARFVQELQPLFHSFENSFKILIECLRLIPLDVATRHPWSQTINSNVSVNGATIFAICKSYMNKTSTGTLSPKQFHHIMNFMLYGRRADEFLENDYLRRLFHFSQGNVKEKTLLPMLIDLCSCYRWFWCSWETAQFCVLSRLRTPLGKAQADTFQAIEGVLRELAADVDNQAQVTSSGSQPALTTMKSSKDVAEKKLRVALMLQFFDCLEKLMYNAFEGFATTLAPTTKAARLFFRTNRPTCQEWLTHLRRPVAILALKSGYPATAVRQGFSYLNGIKSSTAQQGLEFDQVVSIVSDALCQMRSPESIKGLNCWLRDSPNIVRMPWIAGGYLVAQGKLEYAAKEYRAALKGYLNLDQPLRCRIGGDNEEVSAKTPGLLIRNQIKLDKSIVVSCYIDLSDWNECESWLKELSELNSQYSDSLFQGSLVCDESKLSMIEALTKFDSKDYAGASNSFDSLPYYLPNSSGRYENCKELYNPHQFRTQQFMYLLKNFAYIKCNEMNMTSASAKILPNLDLVIESMHDQIRSNVMPWLSPVGLADSMVLKSIFLIQSFIQGHEGNMWGCMLSGNEFHQDISLWQHILRISDAIYDISNDPAFFEHLLNINVRTAHIARKQSNYALAKRLLTKAMYRVIHFGQQLPMVSEALDDVQELVNKLNDLTCNDQVKLSNEMMILQRETAKYLMDYRQEGQAIKLLIHSVWQFNKFYEEISTWPDPGRTSCAKSCIAIAKRLQNNPQLFADINSNADSDLTRAHLITLNQLEDKLAVNGLGWPIVRQNHEDNSISWDTSCGKLFHLSCIMAPRLSKAWFYLAGWCYRLGRKTVDQASIDFFPQLIRQEREKIISLLPSALKGNEQQAIFNVLSKPYYSVNATEDEMSSGIDEKSVVEGPDLCRRQLKLALPSHLVTDSTDLIDSLIAIWQNARSRLFEYYKLSVVAYFKYLQIASDDSSITTHSIKSSDNHVTCTLRLLRLLVKYSSELSSELDIGFKRTLVMPWKDITPQLFSRLNHPEIYVTTKICQLLCQIAQEVPHFVIYPVVVGHATYSQNQKKQTTSETVIKKLRVLGSVRANSGAGDVEDYQNDDDDGDVVDDGFDDDVGDEKFADPHQSSQEIKELNIMEVSYNKILDFFLKQHHLMVCEVQIFVQELRRITLLWEELWLGTVAQYNASFKRRIQQIEEEIERITRNESLNDKEKADIIHDKHTAIMKPIIYALEQIDRITNQKSETVHETRFQEQFSSKTRDVLSAVKDSLNPRDSFLACGQLYRQLQKYTLKHSRLNLNEISPQLCKLNPSVIPLPGVTDSSTDKIVTVQSFLNDIVILPTKTKPKKIKLLGSDGKVYTYLYKGLEDLHLDERIMQLIAVINKMLARAEKIPKPLFRARHYSVTPLGLKSGLIQWVDGATALYLIYKRWQQRELTASKSSQVNNAGKPAVPATAPAGQLPSATTKPSELYYNKLKPLLEKEGISSSAPRSQWPVSILRHVYDELDAETPSDLLAQELWASSIGCADWWQILQSYNRSIAVSSMIGYIIGLGDRHLDNILIDLVSGEVIHIDYNVCFEKGKSLRVPETVPFRLTNNIATALGITQIEGTFRSSCEHVLKIMRQGRESLLTLLEAFVYDPLVDWTSGSVGGIAGAFYGGGATTDDHKGKKEMEREVTAKLFSSTVAEKKATWLDVGESTFESINLLNQRLDSLWNIWLNAKEFFLRKERLKKLQNFLIAALNIPNHPLRSAYERIFTATSMVVENTFDTAGDEGEGIQEYQEAINRRDSVTNEIRNELENSLAMQTSFETSIDIIINHKERLNDYVKLGELGSPPFNVVTHFLQDISKAELISQCQEKEDELISLFQQRRNYIKTSVDVLKSYGSIISLMPLSGTTYTINCVCISWLKDILECSNIAGFSDIVTGAKESIQELDEDDIYANENKVVVLKAIHRGLRSTFNEFNLKVRKSMELQKELSIREEDTGSVTGMTAKINEIATTLSTGRLSILCAILIPMSNLCERILKLETTIAETLEVTNLRISSECWFFNTLYDVVYCIYQNTLIAQFLLSGSDFKNDSLQPSEIANTISVVWNIYNHMEDFIVNFKSVILSESVKLVQIQNHDVLTAIDSFEEVLNNCDIDIEILMQMIVRKLYTDEDTEMDIESVIAMIDQLHDNYSTFRNSDSTSNQGYTLFAAFDGLFTRLENEYESLNQLSSYTFDIPTWAKSISVVNVSQKLIKNTNRSISLESQLFFVKRLVAMRNFFRRVRSYISYTNLNADEIWELPSNQLSQDEFTLEVLSDNYLWFPIKEFLAESVKYRTVGYLSSLLSRYLVFSMDAMDINIANEVESRSTNNALITINEIAKYVLDYSLCIGTVDPHEFSEAVKIIDQYEVSLSSESQASRNRHDLTVADSLLKTYWLQLARFQWMYEKNLVKTGESHASEVSGIRRNIVDKLQKSLQGINLIGEKINDILLGYDAHESVISQKLRWAAGANPSIAATLQSFQNSLESRKTLISKENEAVSEMLAMCNRLLYFDNLRINIDLRIPVVSVLNDLTSRYEQCLLNVDRCKANIDILDEALGEDYHSLIQEPVSMGWIQNKLKETSLQLAENNKEFDLIFISMKSSQETVSNAISDLSKLVAEEQALISEIRNFLDSIAQDEGAQGSNIARSVINSFKSFHETMDSCLKDIKKLCMPKDALNPEDLSFLNDGNSMKLLKNRMEHLGDVIKGIHNQIVSLAQTLSSDSRKDGDPNVEAETDSMIVNTASVDSARDSDNVNKSNQLARDPQTGKVIQARNVYAVNVWCRVKVKLDGRDMHQDKKLSVAEQVDKVLQEAISKDNLCKMYEGWTPWV